MNHLNRIRSTFLRVESFVNYWQPVGELYSLMAKNNRWFIFLLYSVSWLFTYLYLYHFKILISVRVKLGSCHDISSKLTGISIWKLHFYPFYPDLTSLCEIPLTRFIVGVDFYVIITAMLEFGITLDHSLEISSSRYQIR